jgi:hypothetical protein
MPFLTDYLIFEDDIAFLLNGNPWNQRRSVTSRKTGILTLIVVVVVVVVVVVNLVVYIVMEFCCRGTPALNTVWETLPSTCVCNHIEVRKWFIGIKIALLFCRRLGGGGWERCWRECSEQRRRAWREGRRSRTVMSFVISISQYTPLGCWKEGGSEKAMWRAWERD